MSLLIIFAVGADVRKAAEDGFPVHNIIASDISEGWFFQNFFSLSLTNHFE
jgi:hypothetical protein